jgi:hypothetical protein
MARMLRIMDVKRIVTYRHHQLPFNSEEVPILLNRSIKKFSLHEQVNTTDQ